MYHSTLGSRVIKRKQKKETDLVEIEHLALVLVDQVEGPSAVGTMKTVGTIKTVGTTATVGTMKTVGTIATVGTIKTVGTMKTVGTIKRFGTIKIVIRHN